MALQLTVSGNYNDSVTDSYIKIHDLYGSKDRIYLTVRVYTDNSKDYLVREMAPSDIDEPFNFVPSVAAESENFIKQGYVFLKTLTEFTSASDV